jgi:drug/metabolite transporter (DMT)-like permease
MNKSHLLLLIAMNIIWGGTYGATKSLMQHAPYFLVTTTRFALAALPLLAYVAKRYGLRMDRGDLLRCAAMGLATFTLSPALMYAGVGRGRAADAAILTAMEPLLISLGAYLYLRERIAPRTRVALAVAFAGAVLLSEFWRAQGAARPLSIVLIAAAVCCEAVYSVVGKDVLRRQPPLKVVAVALACGSTVNLAVSAAAGWLPRLGGLTGGDWLTLAVYLSLLCTVIGYSVWSMSLKNTAAANVAITIFVQPLGGFVLSWLWVNETPSLFQLLGAGLVVAAVAISARRAEPGLDRITG